MFYRTRARFDSSLKEAGEFSDHFYEVFFSPPENEDE
jgi:hypothetical protein